MIRNAIQQYIADQARQERAAWEKEHTDQPPKLFISDLGHCIRKAYLHVKGYEPTHPYDDYVLEVMRAGVVWEGTGFQRSSASWYDETSDSMWVFTSGALIEVPLDPQRWVERACFIVRRDLTPEEWERHVPGDEAPRSACH